MVLRLSSVYTLDRSVGSSAASMLGAYFEAVSLGRLGSMKLRISDFRLPVSLVRSWGGTLAMVQDMERRSMH